MLLVLVLLVPFAAGKSCAGGVEVDISDGMLSNSTVLHDEVAYAEDFFFRRGGGFVGCPCGFLTCVRKCCPPGNVMANGSCEAGSKTPPWRSYLDALNISGEYYLYYHDGQCAETVMSPLFPDYEEDTFSVTEDGKLYLPYAVQGPETKEAEEFCVDMTDDGEVMMVLCVEEINIVAISYGMIISMPFLLITFIVYAVLPDRNLHGKSLMCYVISLFGAYVLLVIIQMSPHKLENNLCIGIGLSCLFCFMASFFWMNVMSIDIWWAFRGMRGISGSRKEAEQKRFLLYCLYAWGMPVVHVLLVLFLILVADLPPYAWYNPQFGNGKCWFKDGIPTFLYFFGPISALIITNIVLFVITACKINMVQRDTAVLRKDENKRHSYENDKQRFNLYLKLMLAMGVNWSMEIISWAVIYWQVGNLPTYIWYLTDACNALYGVVIFFIFVFKRNIWKLLKRRYYLVTGRPHLARSVTQNAYSPRTTTSTLSHTIDSKSGNYTTESSVYTSEVA